MSRLFSWTEALHKAQHTLALVMAVTLAINTQPATEAGHLHLQSNCSKDSSIRTHQLLAGEIQKFTYAVKDSSTIPAVSMHLIFVEIAQHTQYEYIAIHAVTFLTYFHYSLD